MDALTCLKTRRSIRAYEDRQVDEALLAQVLEAGMYAPTGMGRQSPKMVVVQDRATRDGRDEQYGRSLLWRAHGNCGSGGPRCGNLA